MSSDGTPYRPLTAKVREDLTVVAQTYRGERYYVVGDGLSHEYYRLNEQEYALLSSFDGLRSMQAIKERFEALFVPYRISYQEIQSYLIDFHQKSLLVTTSTDFGRHAFRKSHRKRTKKRLQNAKNFLAIRWRGVNPDRVFRLLTPVCGWFFSTWMLIINVCLMISAVLWLGTHHAEFLRRLPAMRDFFAMDNWAALALVMIFMKLIHEFGHGIVFTKLGGRCHELGVMLLVLMPTLYVNTSDSWKMPSKWQRAAVAAAGVYVELVMAALATFGWWFSHPGPAQNLFLNIMFLGSISAVLFNGNPLLRFDGYFLLSDLIEIPNLQKRASTFARNLFLGSALGIDEGDEYALPWQTRAWLIGYAIAAYLFRFFIVYCIAFFVVGFFRPAGLGEFGKMLSTFLMAMLVIVPSLALIKYFWTPGRMQRIAPKYAAVSTLVVVGLLTCFFLVSFKEHVTCSFTIEPSNAATIYAAHDAVLSETYVAPRQYVKAGQKICLLRNIDVELEVAELEGTLHALDTEEEVLSLSRFNNSESAARSRDIRQQRTTIEARLGELQELLSKLELVSPRDGHVITKWRSPAARQDSMELSEWDGWTLHEENRRMSFKRGQPVCDIGDLDDAVAVLTIDQRDVRYVQEGQDVRLMLDSRTNNTIESKLGRISETETLGSAFSDSGTDGDLESGTAVRDELSGEQNRDVVRPMSTIYRAEVEMPGIGEPLEAGIRGVARIDVGKATLFQRLMRFMHRTFRLEI